MTQTDQRLSTIHLCITAFPTCLYNLEISLVAASEQIIFELLLRS